MKRDPNRTPVLTYRALNPEIKSLDNLHVHVCIKTDGPTHEVFQGVVLFLLIHYLLLLTLCEGFFCLVLGLLCSTSYVLATRLTNTNEEQDITEPKQLQNHCLCHLALYLIETPLKLVQTEQT